MRLLVNLCHKRGCTNLTRAGFRFCMRPDCGPPKEEEEE